MTATARIVTLALTQLSDGARPLFLVPAPGERGRTGRRGAALP